MAKALYIRTLTEPPQRINTTEMCGKFLNLFYNASNVQQNAMCDSFPPKRQKSYMSLSAAGSLSSKATSMLLTLVRALPIFGQSWSPGSPDLEKQEIKSEFHRSFQLPQTLHCFQVHREVRQSGARCLQSKCLRIMSRVARLHVFCLPVGQRPHDALALNAEVGSIVQMGVL